MPGSRNRVLTARPSRATTRHRSVLVLLGVAGLIAIGGAAWAFWTATATGAAGATTGDLGAPTAVVATAPSNSSTVAVSWDQATLGTGEPASGYYVVRVRVADGLTEPACGTSPTAPLSGLACDDLGVVDAVYSYRVTAVVGGWTATSAAGNQVTVVNDDTAPSVSVSRISPVPNENGWISSSPVTVDLVATAGRGIVSTSYSVDGGPTVTVQGDTAPVTVTGDGTHTVTYWALDKGGNTSATGSVEVRIDTVAPDAGSAPRLTTASDSGSSSTDGVTNVTNPTVTGWAETGTIVTLYDGVTPIGSAVATAGDYTIATSGLSQGNHLLSVGLTDPAGNAGPASATTTITIDTSAPPAPPAPTLTAASDSGVSSSDLNTNVTTPTFTGSAEAEATVTLFNGGVSAGTAAATGGSYSVTSSSLATGARTMTVRATDLAGNLSAASAATTITIDVTAPGQPGQPVLAAASDSGRSSTDRTTNVTTPTITGSVTTGTATVTLFDGATEVAAASTSGSYALTTSTLTDGARSITSRVGDIAGNQSVPSLARIVTVDTVAPVAPTVPDLAGASDTGSSNTDNVTKTITPSFSGTNESRAIVALFDGVTQVGTQTTAATSYSILSSTLSEGVHSMSGTSTDIAGNVSVRSAGLTVTIDTTAPTELSSAPTLTAASDTGVSTSDRITSDTTATFTGTAELGAQWPALDGLDRHRPEPLEHAEALNRVGQGGGVEVQVDLRAGRSRRRLRRWPRGRLPCGAPTAAGPRSGPWGPEAGERSG